nr:hypothetical protein [Candidatus Sigynarchaeota archaeon]
MTKKRTAEEITCTACGKTFMQRHGAQKYCHVEGCSSFRKYTGKHYSFITCTACGKLFKPRNARQRNCYKEGCPSFFVKTHTAKHRHITKLYEHDDSISRKDACKRVTCDASNKYRDLLVEKFPGLPVEKFNEIRLEVMKSNCGRHLHPGGLAGGIFYVASNYIDEKHPDLYDGKPIFQNDITVIVGITDVALRRYNKLIMTSIGNGFQKRQSMPRNLGNKGKMIACPSCKKEFLARKNSQIFCCRDCRSSFQRNYKYEKDEVIG